MSFCDGLLIKGNYFYFRAEILYRLQIAPFISSRSVLEPLADLENTKVKTEDPDILDLCHIVPKEVLSLGGGKGYDVEHDPEEEQAFTNWLQCYYKDGMNNLVDHNGRTIWFQGPAGPMKPANAKTRGKRTTKKKAETDHDYESPKKAKKETKIKQEIKSIKEELNGIKKESKRIVRTKKEPKSVKKEPKSVKREPKGFKKEPKVEPEEEMPARRSTRKRSA